MTEREEREKTKKRKKSKGQPGTHADMGWTKTCKRHVTGYERQVRMVMIMCVCVMYVLFNVCAG